MSPWAIVRIGLYALLFVAVVAWLHRSRVRMNRKHDRK